MKQLEDMSMGDHSSPGERTPPPHSPLTTCSRPWETWPWVHESGRVSLDSQLLQHLGDWVLYLPWRAQQS